MSTERDYHLIAGDERAAVEFENGALSVHKLDLPECAQDVLDGRGASSAYWSWLIVRYVAADLARRVDTCDCRYANPYE